MRTVLFTELFPEKRGIYSESEKLTLIYEQGMRKIHIHLAEEFLRDRGHSVTV